MQAARQPGRQAGSQAGKQAGRQAGREAEDRHISGVMQSGRQLHSGRKADRQALYSGFESPLINNKSNGIGQ